MEPFRKGSEISGPIFRKEQNVAEKWVSPAEAASILGVSERTIRKRVARGEYEARDAAGGRREVLVEVPERSEDVRNVFRAADQAADRQIQIASAAVGLAESHAETYRRDLKAAKWSARLAWLVVAALVSASSWGLWRVTRTITTQEGELKTATGRLADAVAIGADLRRELLRTTAEATAAGEKAQEAASGLVAAERRLADARVQLAEEKATRASLASWPLGVNGEYPDFATIGADPTLYGLAELSRR